MPKPLEPEKPEAVGLPPIVFLYTIDQIAAMLNMTVDSVNYKYLYYHLRSTGMKSPHQMMARNIANPNDPADWRVTQSEFIRWLRLKGFRVFSLGRIY